MYQDLILYAHKCPNTCVMTWRAEGPLCPAGSFLQAHRLIQFPLNSLEILWLTWIYAHNQSSKAVFMQGLSHTGNLTSTISKLKCNTLQDVSATNTWLGSSFCLNSWKIPWYFSKISREIASQIKFLVFATGNQFTTHLALHSKCLEAFILLCRSSAWSLKG